LATPAITQPARSRQYGPSLRAILRVVLTVVASVIALYLVYRLRKPLAWVFLAAFIAVAASAPVAALQRYMRRGVAIALVYLLIVLVPIGMLALFVPPIVEQGNNLADNAPRYARDVTDWVNKNESLRKLNDKYDLTSKLQDQAAKLPSKLGDVAGVLTDIGSGIINSIFAGITILTLSLFMIGGGPRWRRQFIARHSPQRAEALERLFDRIAEAVGGYVRGALLQALIAGFSSWIVLLILGVPYAAPLAVVIFIFDLIPLVGATLAAVLVGLVTLFHNFPTTTIVWGIWSIIYQQVENNVIQPRIQSRTVQVEPIIVIVSVLFGASLFGVFGAVLAVPIAATIQVSVAEYMRYRRETLAEVITPGAGPTGTVEDIPPPPAGPEPEPPGDPPP
jgi:predicted PurR-regulated permease PerM